jgi:hypothetical protein
MQDQDTYSRLCNYDNVTSADKERKQAGDKTQASFRYER